MKKKLTILVLIIGIFSIALLYSYYNYQFWKHFKTDNFEALVEYEGNSIKGLRGRQILIHQNFEKYMKQIDKYASDSDIELIINQGYRSDKQTVSNAVVKPVKSSNHLAGFAIDFNIKNNGKKYLSTDLERDKLDKLPDNIQHFINEIRKNKDLRWGGDFRREDPVHIDYPINIKSKSNWREFSRACALDYSNRIPKWKVWK
ncbi:M15 family metallopeptidase [Bernardetia sp.]|uniref:M15 family metallopeptidase n=1 Tax=Bernardetia sp. TaxID=1937974 RepID=UPI0025C2754E|nr:M15 family metallopeptidase [Bernardetia sp.]